MIPETSSEFARQALYGFLLAQTSNISSRSRIIPFTILQDMIID